MKQHRFQILLFLCMALVGCMAVKSCTGPPVQEVARDAIASAKGYTDTAKQNHPECATGAQSTACTAIAKTVGAKDSTIDALEAYCSSPAFDAGTGPCTPPSGDAGTAAANILASAVANLNQEIADIKALQ
jgi:hypothetical protein